MEIGKIAEILHVLSCNNPKAFFRQLEMIDIHEPKPIMQQSDKLEFGGRAASQLRTNLSGIDTHVIMPGIVPPATNWNLKITVIANPVRTLGVVIPSDSVDSPVLSPG